MEKTHLINTTVVFQPKVVETHAISLTKYIENMSITVGRRISAATCMHCQHAKENAKHVHFITTKF